MSTMRVVPSAVRIITSPGRSSSYRSDHRDSLPQADVAASHAARLCRFRRPRSLSACLRWRHTSGSSPSNSHAPRTSSRIGSDLFDQSMPTCDCSAISFSVLDRPPRVGSRMQRIAVSDVAEHRRHQRVQRGAVALEFAISNSSPSRCASIAMPWSPIEPLRRPCRPAARGPRRDRPLPAPARFPWC